MYEPYGFAGLTGQNRADTQVGAMAPTMPGYAGLDRMPFADMRTPQDQIHWLYLYATNLALDSITAKQAQALVDEGVSALKEYVDRQDAAITADVAQKYNYLVNLINTLTEFPGVVYDPTQGKPAPVKFALEHVYDFDRPFSVSVADYDGLGYTAKAYDSKGWTAREFDVAAGMLTYQDSLKEG